MIFFTRRLYEGIQPESGWERKADREWQRRRALYEKYLAALGPMLPREVRQLSETTLHDGVITSATKRGTALRIVVDASSALGAHRGRIVELLFEDVTRTSGLAPAGLRGRWWFYEEFHLASDDRFRMDLLFDEGELEIEAGGLTIRSRASRAGARRRR